MYQFVSVKDKAGHISQSGIQASVSHLSFVLSCTRFNMYRARIEIIISSTDLFWEQTDTLFSIRLIFSQRAGEQVLS